MADTVFGLPARVSRLVLASSSPRRVELLREAGFDPVVAPQDVDEAPRAGEAPIALVERLARTKATSALAGARAGDVVVAADTTVWFQGVDLGKPVDEADARRMLRMLSGRTHHVSTGACVAVVSDGAQGATAGEASRSETENVTNHTEGNVTVRAFVETTDVTFFELSDADIEAYVATGEPADKAGAYGIQGLGRALVSGISGDYFNVVGLPVARLLRELDGLLAGPRP